MDAGAEIVAEFGPESLTMEGVALRAGVSKALPYQHFEDAEDLLVALAVREAAAVAERISAVFGEDHPLRDGLSKSLAAYFDVVAERGVLMGALLQYRFSPSRQLAVDEIWARIAEFFAQRFRAESSLPPPLCLAAAYIMLAAVVGAQQTWINGLVSRRAVEELLLHMTVDGLAGLSTRKTEAKAVSLNGSKSRVPAASRGT